MLNPKDTAPAFSLPSTSGRTVSTKDLRGKRFVLYFYPRDDTPGCTREACDFRDNVARLGAAGVDVFGVSKDGIASHERFKAKYALPFDLLSDEGNALAKSYGAFGEKLMYGKPVTGVIRSTFLIGADGRIERAWSPVRVDGHVDAVLEAIAGGASSRPAAARGTLVPPRSSAVKKPAGGARVKSEAPAPSRKSTAKKAAAKSGSPKPRATKTPGAKRPSGRKPSDRKS